MKIYVVMGNDYPKAAFSSEQKAEEFIAVMKAADKKADRSGRIYWRSYEFELDKGDK